MSDDLIVSDLRARAMVQSVGEVPMPEPDIELCYEESVLCHSDKCIRQYGDAREAAGYARGVKAATPYLGTIDDALRNFDADLRGEVKP